MLIELHIVSLAMEDDAKDAIRHASQGNEFDVDAGRFVVPAFTEQFEKILAVTAKTSGIRWTPWVTYNRKEMESTDIFQIWGRRHASETDPDSTRNLDTLRALHLLPTGSELRIKILTPIHLTRFRGSPVEALRVGTWTEEYVIGRAVKWALEQCSLRGYQTLPVLRTKDNQPLENVWQIHTESVLPPTVPDLSVLDHQSDFKDGLWHKRYLGSLTYERDGFPSGPDFWRTAEPWCSNDLPLWIVTRRVVDCFKSAKLKGWHFRPALWLGSPLQKEYLKRWTALVESMATNPRNRIW